MHDCRLEYCNTIASILPTAIDIGLVTHIATVIDAEFAIAITCNLLLLGYEPKAEAKKESDEMPLMT